jgi:hypothetical protein
VPGPEVGRAVCGPEPRWPGRDVPVVTGPRESQMGSPVGMRQTGLGKRTPTQNKNQLIRCEWLCVWELVDAHRLERKLGWGTGAVTEEQQGENIGVRPSASVRRLLCSFSKLSVDANWIPFEENFGNGPLRLCLHRADLSSESCAT